jgi:hypothetical protein
MLILRATYYFDFELLEEKGIYRAMTDNDVVRAAVSLSEKYHDKDTFTLCQVYMIFRSLELNNQPTGSRLGKNFSHF